MSQVIPFSAAAAFYADAPNTPLPNPAVLEICQEEYAHETAKMLFWGGDVDVSGLYSGTPVVIDYANADTGRTFYGYVNHTERNSTGFASVSLMERNSLTIYCVGASYFMKQPDTKSWFQTTLAPVVQQIAGLFGLSTSLQQDTTVWPSLQMAGQSYFEFLCKWAKRIGYAFYPSGPQLVFKPRQVNPRAIGAVAASYDYRNDVARMPIFRPVIGSTTPGTGRMRTRQVSGIDPRTGKLFTSTITGSGATSRLGTNVDSSVFTEINHEIFGSQAEATARVKGDALYNQMYLRADALAAGDPNVSAGSLIYVQNANGAQNGLWYVNKVRHCLDQNKYEMHLDLGRESRGPTKAIGTVKPFASQPKAKLVNKTWRAA